MCERRRTENPRIVPPFLLIVLALYLAVCGGCAGNNDAKANVTVIQHIVFILKENHTLDNYFGTFPGADGVASVITSNGQVIPLSPMPDPYLVDNLCNSWDCAILAMDGGRMDKFDLISGGALSAYTQASGQDIPNYWAYARRFVLADHYFTSVHGPSLPNHLFTIAAQSGGAISNSGIQPSSMNCDGSPRGTVTVIDASGNRTEHSPCFDFQTLADSLTNAGITWRFYETVYSPRSVTSVTAPCGNRTLRPRRSFQPMLKPGSCPR